MGKTVFEAEDFLMNTNVEQKIFGKDPVAIYNASIKKLNGLENMMSFYRKASEVSLLNRLAGKGTVTLSEEMISVLIHSQYFSHLSQNAFNILVAPLVQLWKDSGTKNKLPSHSVIKKRLRLCKNENLVLNEKEHSAYLTKRGCMIDLGGIGKGFAADACCNIYKEMGAASAFINLGGNVKTLGNRPDGTQWTVGLQHPDKTRGHCYGAIMCSDQSVVTSGPYERYQEIKGAKYHHILDGKTGYPSEAELKSVTVISQSSMEADALSTAAFVLGLEKGKDLIYNSNCIGAVFFAADNKIYVTKGIKQHLCLMEKLSCYAI